MRRYLSIALSALLLMAAGNAVAGVTASSANGAQDHHVLPPLALPGLDGRTHSMAEWGGKVVMLNFLASWCPTCQYETPSFTDWQHEFGGAQLQIVGVAIDEARPMANFARTYDVNFPILLSDPQRSVALLQQWGNEKQLLPYTVVIDHTGRIVYRQYGTFDQEIFDDVVRPLLHRQ